MTKKKLEAIQQELKELKVKIYQLETENKDLHTL